MRWAVQAISLERLNAGQFIAFSLLEAARRLARPDLVDRVEIHQAGRCESVRLLVGFLLNFDLPELPVRAACSCDEPRLVFRYLPDPGRARTLASLINWRGLDDHFCTREVNCATPLEIAWSGRSGGRAPVITLDEDTFTACTRARFDLVAPLSFVSKRLA
jgi:hypothetical protein